MSQYVLQTQKTVQDYGQRVNEGSNSTKNGDSTGKTTQKSTAKSTQKSDSKREQKTTGNRDLTNNSVRDLNSHTVKENNMLEQANIGFEISFKIKITGKIPSLPEFDGGGC